jgi:hypothetical protein
MSRNIEKMTRVILYGDSKYQLGNLVIGNIVEVEFNKMIILKMYDMNFCFLVSRNPGHFLVWRRRGVSERV